SLRDERIALAGAQRAIAGGSPLRWPHPLHGASAEAWGKVFRRSLREGMGGLARQTCRLPVCLGPLSALAQVQMLARAGTRNRRLHGTARQRARFWRVTGRLLQGWQPSLRRKGRNRIQRADAVETAPTNESDATKGTSIPRRSRRAARDLDRAATDWGICILGMDPGRKTPASKFPRAALRQAPARNRSRAGDSMKARTTDIRADGHAV